MIDKYFFILVVAGSIGCGGSVELDDGSPTRGVGGDRGEAFDASCTHDDDCASGLCLVGRCRGCITIEHCRVGECCRRGLCVAGATTTCAAKPRAPHP